MSSPKKNTVEPRPERRVVSPWEFWLASKRPVFWFCGKFSLLLLAYYCFSALPGFEAAMGRYLQTSARVSHGVLLIMGEACQITQATLWSPGHAITILPTCSAVELMWFYCAAVMAFPSSFVRKVAGIFVGVPLLIVLNLSRIVSLYYVEVHFYGAFDTIHEEVWPAALIIATLLICSGWIQWVRCRKPVETDVTA